MSDPLAAIRATLTRDFIAHAYPVLIEPGVRDEDVLIHSLGCSLWTVLGHELGYSALVEAPAPAAAGADIRADSLWFERAGWRPVVLVEFERFEAGPRGEAKLAEKVRNLLEAAARWELAPRLLVLSAWSAGVVDAPRTDALRALLRDGFINAAGVRIRGPSHVPLLLHRLLLGVAPGGRLRLAQNLLEVV
ncbi:hypothetical protein [Thiohalocapsa sp. ML1]|jgi:hypothetical protein|uniref:hypothetical protein n=1 Tax=Thiohalocapsa sp. ML1 TaxID=1431688 RepID=UPI000731F8A8|nr:hypothetical protein [Thiohalocapsa sp. ML1]